MSACMREPARMTVVFTRIIDTSGKNLKVSQGFVEAGQGVDEGMGVFDHVFVGSDGHRGHRS
jgi:hypothetical protein